MRVFARIWLVVSVLALSSCANNNDNAHTTATTIVPPPVRQQLHVEFRPAANVAAKIEESKLRLEPAKPLLVFHLPNGKTFRPDEPVAIDFSLANAKLKGDGGDYRVRYIVDDEEMQWIDRSEQVVLSGWTSGKHTIRLELVGPDGWPLQDQVMTRELTVTK